MNSNTNNFKVIDANIQSDVSSTVNLWDKIKDEGQNDNLRRKLESLYLQTQHKPSIVFHLVDQKTSTPIGIQGILSKQFKHNSTIYSSAVAADFVIDRHFRTLGPALYLFKQVATICTKKYDFIYGFPNVKAAPVLKYAGYTVEDKVIRYSRVLNSKEILKTALPSLISSLISIPLNIALYVFDYTRYVINAYKLKTINSNLDFNDIDTLWDNANKNTTIIYSVRNEAALKWRYSENSDNFKIVKIYYEKNSELKGYFIYFIKNKICTIVDFYSEMNKSTINTLFPLFIYSMRKIKVKAILFETMAPPDFIKNIKRNGFIARAKRNIFFKSEKIKIDQLLENIYITASDEDAI